MFLSNFTIKDRLFQKFHTLRSGFRHTMQKLMSVGQSAGIGSDFQLYTYRAEIDLFSYCDRLAFATFDLSTMGQ